jgi:hypothetical protein
VFTHVFKGRKALFLAGERLEVASEGLARIMEREQECIEYSRAFFYAVTCPL